MSLNNLKPAKGSNKTAGKRLGRGQGSGKGVVHLQKDIKGLSLDQVTQEKSVLRAVKCPFKEESQNFGLKILIGLSITL